MSDEARELIESADNEVLFSAASIWEIAIKLRLGKLVADGAKTAQDNFSKVYTKTA